MHNRLGELLLLGAALVTLSTSGVLARYIDLPPTITTWIRVNIAILVLYLIIRLQRIPLKFEVSRYLVILILSSVCLSLHWITYFESVQQSNISIGMLSLFTYPVIAVFLEPFFLKTRFKWIEIILALLSLGGIALLIPEFDFSNQYTKGILLGLISALMYTLRNLLLKMSVFDYSGIILMFFQLCVISVILLPFMWIIDWEVQTLKLPGQWLALLLLGMITTALGHTLFVKSFRYFSISSISIISCLTPIIGILLGVVFLDEIPTARTVLGGILILSASLGVGYMELKK